MTRIMLWCTVRATTYRPPPCKLLRLLWRRNGRNNEAQQPRLLGRPAPLQIAEGPPKKAPGAFIAGFVPAKDVVRLPFYPPPTVPADFVAQHKFPPPPPPRPASGELNCRQSEQHDPHPDDTSSQHSHAMQIALTANQVGAQLANGLAVPLHSPASASSMQFLRFVTSSRCARVSTHCEGG